MKDLGVLVPLVTPCRPEGEIDLAGLTVVTRHMLAAGCHALFVAGSTGRGPWWSRSDRALICRTVAETAGPAVPLFAGCMASGLSDMLDNARAMKDAGARFAVLTAPGYFVYSQREVEAIFRKFADRCPLPVLVYDIPAFTGLKLDLDLVRRLARSGNVIGFKDSSADLPRFQALVDTLSDLPDFYLLQGKEHLLADSLLAGASGLVVSLVHIEPRLFVALHAACRARQTETIHRLQAAITKILHGVETCLRNRPETSTLFFLLGHALQQQGLGGHLRLDHEGTGPDHLAREAENLLALAHAVQEEGSRA